MENEGSQAGKEQGQSAFSLKGKGVTVDFERDKTKVGAVGEDRVGSRLA